MAVYPGVTATYSPAAWHRAQLMTDSQITDRLLAGCEAAIEAQAADPHRHERNLRQCREMVAYYAACVAWAERHGTEAMREARAADLAHAQQLLAEAEAAMARECVA